MLFRLVIILSKVVLMKNISFTGHIAIYLSIHPFGISVESIVNYIKNIDKNVTSQQVENLLVNNQILFENFQHDDLSLWKLVNFS